MTTAPQPDEQSTQASTSETTQPASGIPRIARVVGATIAPTTLITALLFYFGWSHAYYFFDYFGVHSTTLGLTTSDYLMRSQDGLFVPLVVLAFVCLMTVRLHQMASRRINSQPAHRRWRGALHTVTVAGLLATAAGVASIVIHTPLNDRVSAAPIALATGVILLAYTTHMRRTRLHRPVPHQTSLTVTECATVFALVGISLFWAANDYSAAVGRSRASQFVSELSNYPETIVYSAQNLNIAGPGIDQTHCPAVDAAYKYRYTGLTLMLQSGNQYVFLPRRWTSADGAAIVAPRSDSIRLVFIPGSGLHGSGLDPEYACSTE